MDRDEMASFLKQRGHGVLSLATAAGAYGTPISYGYYEEGLFLYLHQFGDSSRKFEMIEESPEATLTVYEIAGPDEWASVIVEGEPRSVGDAADTPTLVERLVAQNTLLERADFPSFDLEGDAFDSTFFLLWIEDMNVLRGERWHNA